MDGASAPGAGAIAGALADGHRRSVFAAVQLGAANVDAVAAMSGVSSAQAAKALGKLVDVGLVVAGDGGLSVAGEVFQHAAREALARPGATEHDALPPNDRKVMNAFVVDGRLLSIPSTPSKRRGVLDWRALCFERGGRYCVGLVTLAVGRRHADTAALRRYLVDEGFLDRADGHYWRSGGSVPT